MKLKLPLLITLILLNNYFVFSQYNGTGSVTQGIATTTTTNLYPQGVRVAGVGSITSTDDNTWIVPAATNYANVEFPFCPDMHNVDGTTYNNAAEALQAYSNNDIVEIDSNGETYTAYIFGDNYFEIYINGVFVGKDAIPFTQFNSHIVKFKVAKPFTIAMMLVDWEENLGLGSERNGGSNYHAGDGGMVAVIKDSNDLTVATTGSEWKAQTFYTAPIKNLSCPTENGNLRLSDNCDTSASNDGSSDYGIHLDIDSNWETSSFDDSKWPNATTYTNATIGVNNKPSYTNFTDVFDDDKDDAEFIWSTNVILDNLVLVRHTISNPLSTEKFSINDINIYPNPVSEFITIETGNLNFKVNLFDLSGKLVLERKNTNLIDVSVFPMGVYLLEVSDLHSNQKLIKKITITKTK